MRTLPLLIVAPALVLGGCEPPPVTGVATRANIASQVIDPAPETTASDGTAAGTARAVAGVRRYASGKVITPVKP